MKSEQVQEILALCIWQFGVNVGLCQQNRRHRCRIPPRRQVKTIISAFVSQAGLGAALEQNFDYFSKIQFSGQVERS